MKKVLCPGSTSQQEKPCYLPGYKPVENFHKAASQGDLDKVHSFLTLKKNLISQVDKNKRTALHFACAYGHPEVAQILLKRKCEINPCDSDRCTPLIKASQHQHEACVKILLQYDANPNAADAKRNTALHYAVYNDDSAMVAMLLENHADPEVKAKDGFTPLIAAVVKDNLQIAAILLKKANVNATDECKRTALFHAIIHQSKDMIQLLLEHGADDGLVDSFGHTLRYYLVTDNLDKYTEMHHDCIEKMHKKFPQSQKGESEATENSRLTNEPGPHDSSLTAKEKEVKDQLPEVPEEKSTQTAVLPVKEDARLHLIAWERMLKTYYGKKKRDCEYNQHSNSGESSGWYPALCLAETSVPSGAWLTSIMEVYLENAQKELVSCLVPQKENKPHMAELPIRDETNLNEDEKLESHGKGKVLENEQKAPEIRQESNPGVENPEGPSTSRLSKSLLQLILDSP